MAKQSKKYLLEKTSESEAQVDKIIALLQSTEFENVKLALQFLEVGGIPDRVWTYLVAIWWTYAVAYEGDKLLKDFFEKQANQDFYERLKYIYDYGYSFHEYDFSALFEDEEYPFPALIDKNELANQIVSFGVLSREAMAKYCLVHQTMPVKKLLTFFLEDDYLDLSNLSLDFLPKEVGEFTQIIELDISENHFTDIPDEIAHLQKLESITYRETPLSDESLQKLKRYFPKIIAEQISDDAANAFNENNYDEALELVNEALEVYNMNTDAWNIKGAVLQYFEKKEEALDCFKKAVQIEPQNTLAWSNWSIYLHDIQRFEESLEVALKGLQIFEEYPATDRQWEAKMYFCKAQGLFELNRLEESELVYFEALKRNPNDDTSLYNLACIYARWQQKNKVLELLQKAIDCNEENIELAKVDTDFEEYWEDKSFKNLLESQS